MANRIKQCPPLGLLPRRFGLEASASMGSSISAELASLDWLRGDEVLHCGADDVSADELEQLTKAIRFSAALTAFRKPEAQIISLHRRTRRGGLLITKALGSASLPNCQSPERSDPRFNVGRCLAKRWRCERGVEVVAGNFTRPVDERKSGRSNGTPEPRLPRCVR